jgi:hypothetical protein
MKRAAVRLLTAGLVAGSTGLAFVPVAEAADTSIVPATEAWYQANPTCAQPSGCLTTGALPVPPPVELPTSPYPAGTMHVGWASSAETARSYLAFPIDTVTGTLTGAELDVPLDTATADGDQQSATAKIQVCLVTGEIVRVEGSISPPPAVSCAAHADVTYVATPTPHLHANLAPLLLGLPTTSGIALLPDATKSGPSDAWRVVFSAHDRADAAKTPPATLKLALADKTVVSTPEQPAVELPGPDPGTGFAAAPSTGGLVAPGPVLEAPAVTPPVAPVVNAPVAALPAAQTVRFGYAYPGVWLLPLAFLILVPLAASALTKDLAPV